MGDKTSITRVAKLTNALAPSPFKFSAEVRRWPRTKLTRQKSDGGLRQAAAANWPGGAAQPSHRKRTKRVETGDSNADNSIAPQHRGIALGNVAAVETGRAQIGHRTIYIATARANDCRFQGQESCTRETKLRTGSLFPVDVKFLLLLALTTRTGFNILRGGKEAGKRPPPRRGELVRSRRPARES